MKNDEANLKSQLTWAPNGVKKLIDTPWVKVEERSYVLPDQSVLDDYLIVKESDGVTVIAQTEDGKLLVVRQYRPGPNQLRYDFPGGAVDKDDALTAAKRELLEETGYESDDWTVLGGLEPAPHRLDATVHGFLAVNCRQVREPNHEATEFIQVEQLSPAALEELIYNNQFKCALCISAYFQAKHAFFSRQCEVCV